MGKMKLPTTKQVQQFRQEILDTMEEIAIDIPSQTNNLKYSQYANQRDIINRAFQCRGYSRCEIIARLAILDVFYSTNVNRRYFGFDDMADAILSLGTRQQACDYFYSIACGAKDTKNVFSATYGIHKNGGNFGRATSLMSKYAYYELLQNKNRYPLGFPIYDSLVRLIYPKVSRKLGIARPMLKPTRNNARIEDYIDRLNDLRIAIFGNNANYFNGFQQFDILDAYLWRMGKFEVGNLSILLKKADYLIFINNVPLNGFPTFIVAVRAALKQGQPIFNGCSNNAFMSVLHSHWLKL